jgi:hypothetical protein
MVPSLKLSFVSNGNNPTGVGLARGSTIRFGSLGQLIQPFKFFSPRVGLGHHIHGNGPQWISLSVHCPQVVLQQGRCHLRHRGEALDPPTPEGVMW